MKPLMNCEIIGSALGILTGVLFGVYWFWNVIVDNVMKLLSSLLICLFIVGCCPSDEEMRLKMFHQDKFSDKYFNKQISKIEGVDGEGASSRYVRIIFRDGDELKFRAKKRYFVVNEQESQ